MFWDGRVTSPRNQRQHAPRITLRRKRQGGGLFQHRLCGHLGVNCNGGYCNKSEDKQYASSLGGGKKGRGGEGEGEGGRRGGGGGGGGGGQLTAAMAGKSGRARCQPERDCGLASAVAKRKTS
jgi:hypothetical protein